MSDALRGGPLVAAAEWIRKKPVQIVMLSGTLSRTVERHILNRLQMKRSEICTITGNIDRPELGIHVIDIVSQENMLPAAARLAKALSATLQHDERIIVFVNDKASIDTFATYCHSAKHHSDLIPPETKEYFLGAFEEGEFRVIVATTGLSIGYNYQKIRHTIIVHGCFGLREVGQQVGRCGRDKNESHCFYLDLKAMNRMIPQPVRVPPSLR